MGDSERDIFWLGRATQSLLTLARNDSVVKSKGGILDTLIELTETLRRIDVSGSPLLQAQSWIARYAEKYSEDERIRRSDKEEFALECQGWINSISDIMKERYAHPKEIYESLVKINIIYDAITQLQTAEHAFVCTSPSLREIKEKVTSAIDTTQQNDDILLTGYFDNALVDRLIKACRRGVVIRLIIPPYKAKEMDNIDATKRLKKELGMVRQHHASHARLWVFSQRAALVSSADPKTDGLDVNYEAGIWTTNRTLIESVRNFFNDLWKESIDWQEPLPPNLKPNKKGICVSNEIPNRSEITLSAVDHMRNDC